MCAKIVFQNLLNILFKKIKHLSSFRFYTISVNFRTASTLSSIAKWNQESSSGNMTIWLGGFILYTSVTVTSFCSSNLDLRFNFPLHSELLDYTTLFAILHSLRTALNPSVSLSSLRFWANYEARATPQAVVSGLPEAPDKLCWVLRV